MNPSNRAHLLVKHALLVSLICILIPRCGDADQSRFDSERIVEHVKFLASDSLEGRLAGSRGTRMASEYIKDRFVRLGLRPGGENGSYFQDFSFVSGVVTGEANELQVTCGKKSHPAEYGVDFTPLGASENAEVEGKLVYIGFGLKNDEHHYNDFGDTDLSGKIAVARSGIPPALEGFEQAKGKFLVRKKAMLAREAGAAALLLIRERDSEEAMDRITYDGTPGDVGIPLAAVSMEYADQVLGCGGLAIDPAQDVATPFVMQDVRVKLRTEVIQERATGRNVLAVLPGSDPSLSSRFLVVGAHYDHIGTKTAPDGSKIIFNGADDNASGVAGLLELAASLSENHPGRSILFITFDAEELGALGSLHFTKNPTIPRESISAMVNLDMIGRMKDRILIVSGYDTSPMWDELLDKSNEGIDLEIKKSAGGFGGSDHTSFYKDDIPVLFFFTGAHDDYNTPRDDWDRINSEGEAVILQYVDRVILDICSAAKEPEFVKSQVKSHGQGRSGLSVYMGTVPDFTFEGKGFAIIGTKEGSPLRRQASPKGM